MRCFQTLTAVALCALLVTFGCRTTAEGGIPEGSCFPKGDMGEDFTEADLYCQDTYCPEVRCVGRIVAEATCSRNLAITGYHQCDCECCDAQIAVGGTAANPEVWEEKYTCLLPNAPPNDCEENIEVTLELVQSGVCGQTIDWRISEGPGMGTEYTGTLNAGSFNWSTKPSAMFEESGCWQFDEGGTEFNKLSAGADFDCVGIGVRGENSTPDDTPSCDEIRAAGIGDFTACPPAPPSSPID